MKETGSYPVDVLSEHELEPGERLTLIMMYTLASPANVVWESAKDLAERAGYSVRGMQKHLKALTDNGWIESTSEVDPRGGGRFHGYKLLRPVGSKSGGE